MAEALVSAEADAVCGAGYGERAGERVNRRNGYRERERDWDTRAGTVELAIPKLRSGSYFPSPDRAAADRRCGHSGFLAGALPRQRRPPLRPLTGYRHRQTASSAPASLSAAVVHPVGARPADGE
jgi:hypothetical protein